MSLTILTLRNTVKSREMTHNRSGKMSIEKAEPLVTSNDGDKGSRNDSNHHSSMDRDSNRGNNI